LEKFSVAEMTFKVSSKISGSYTVRSVLYCY